MSQPHRPAQDIGQKGFRPEVVGFEPPLRRRCLMEEVCTDDLSSHDWTEQDVELLKSLVALKIPMDIISWELDRSWTAASLKALELGLNLFS